MYSVKLNTNRVAKTTKQTKSHLVYKTLFCRQIGTYINDTTDVLLESPHWIEISRLCKLPFFCFSEQ